jgi:general secretion pathway protein G
VIINVSMFSKVHFSSQKGFTLIELLVVLGVLGIIAGVILAAINPIAQIQKSNDAKRKSDLEQMQRALELYYQDNNKYPPSTGNKINNISWGSVWTGYMSSLPNDPIPSHHYVYVVTNTQQTYYLYANLERGKYDPQACNAMGTACPNATANSVGSSCGAVCNYGVSSPNTSP